MFFNFLCLYTIDINYTNCPIALEVFPYEDYQINVPKDFPISFANWGKDVTVEIYSAKTYGPYTNEKHVFGMYFKKYESKIKVSTIKKNSTLVIGCLKEGEKLEKPGGYAHPVGKYESEYKDTKYPILFTDEQTLSKTFELAYAVIVGIGYVTIVVVLYKKGLFFEDLGTNKNDENNEEEDIFD